MKQAQAYEYLEAPFTISDGIYDVLLPCCSSSSGWDVSGSSRPKLSMTYIDGVLCWCRHIKALCMGCCTVVSVIHQPSSEVFELFDQLCLLASGEVLTFGPAGQAACSFNSVGLPVPSHANPSDHFLHCINADFEVCNVSSYCACDNLN